MEETSFKLIVYYILSPSLAFCLYILGVDISVFINLNGGLCAFVVTFLIIYMQVKCRYMSHNDDESRELVNDPEIEETWKERDEHCLERREEQTNCGKAFDILALCLLGLFSLVCAYLTTK